MSAVLLELDSMMKKSLDPSNCYIIIFMNLSLAFDTIAMYPKLNKLSG